NWSANFDVRYAPFEADITGNLGPAPVQAKVEVDPTIVSIGVAYRF
ncbi:MAG: OmpW family outer membrane protein, partial [Pseudomonadota bacterium]|nr:OmpW family outer membrane protein [Pseudomonadota bacterium]